jgi:D-lyxose ketol-isomerase
VPKSEGDAQFLLHGRILPTLAQFMPQDWGQSSQSSTLEKEATREKCNVILQYGNNTSTTSSDEGLTTLKCETLRAKVASICEKPSGQFLGLIVMSY